MSSSQLTKYRPSIIALHWLTVLLLIGVYASMELHESFPRGSETRESLKNWHYLLGLSVFALTWLRLALRAFSKTPPILPQPPSWQMGLAHLMAFLLYAMMLALPVLGYLAQNAEGHAITLFGAELPRLIAENPALSKTLEEFHKTVGNASYFLIGLHALAALYHHYLRRDDTLRRMLLR